MTKSYDALIIGGGHNGLVCAFYLARAGLKVRVLERRHVVGGAAVTEEFHPGFRNSTASYTVSLLRPKVIKDMRLHERGWRIIERTISNFFPHENGYLKLGGGTARTQAEFARYSAKDAETFPHYEEALELANRGEFGLSAGIVSNNAKLIRDFRRNVRAGMVMVNLPTAGVDYHVPFGGTRGSSYGPREQGFAAVEFYTQIKTVYTGD